MSRPFSSVLRSRLLLATLVAAVVPAAVRAQSTQPDFPPQPTEARVYYAGNQSRGMSEWYPTEAHAEVNDPAGMYEASATAVQSQGRLSIYVATQPSQWNSHNTEAIARLGGVLQVSNFGPAALMQPFQFYTHGTFDATAAPQSNYSFQYYYSISEWTGTQWSLLWRTPIRVNYSSQYGTTYELENVTGASFLVAAGSTRTFGISASLYAQAAAGAIADMSHTARIYATPTAGLTAAGVNGFLSEQAIPEWAQPAVVTTPEPATLLLVAPALALVAVVRRRRREG
ncbi:hypothetical protein [Roseisolibacter agri]|uniref:PEP-CTERM protein-sorting domain-containing protein n=1 Tax=Roseisolibacter agri TaxID=2014610 RepID=A0AA37VBK6_9BACT|nr:hypothetical protein [Roseisolibacter agri]GLC26548.1 hypothetical protein rosag_30610 [Roseisolibacter agri]